MLLLLLLLLTSLFARRKTLATDLLTSLVVKMLKKNRADHFRMLNTRRHAVRLQVKHILQHYILRVTTA